MGRLTDDARAEGEPCARSAHCCTIVPGRLVGFPDVPQVLVVFGGLDAAGAVLSDVHALPLPAPGRATPLRWERLCPSSAMPAGRALHCACELRDGLYIFGGCGTEEALLDDIWALGATGAAAGARWTTPYLECDDAPPAPRRAASLTATGPAEAVLFGGLTAASCSNEVWLLQELSDADGAAGHSAEGRVRWSAPRTAGASPAPRSQHTACHLPADSDRRLGYVAVIGGRAAGGCLLGDVHLLCLSSMRWAAVAVQGQPVPPRCSASCAVVGRRICVWGGIQPQTAEGTADR
jgi:hypothetical protein